MKVGSYNVNGLNNPIKRNKVISKMKKEGIDVLFLQETHLTTEEHGKLRRNGYSQEYSSSYKSGRRRGVSILISSKICFEMLKVVKDKEGRYVLVMGRMAGELVTLMNVYAPPGSDWKFYKQLLDLVMVDARGMLIGGGDLNLRLNPLLDSSGNHKQKCNVAKKFRKTMLELGIVDIWRELNPVKRDYTYFSAPHSLYSRIDYFLIFARDRYKIQSCDIGVRDLSDHSPVYLKVIMGKEKKKTLWRLNTSLLNGQAKEEIEKEISEYVELNDNGEVSPSTLWDACKAVMRGKLIARSTYRKKNKEKILKELQMDLGRLEKTHKDNLDSKILNEIKKKQAEINDLLTQEIQKRMIYTKQRYYEAGSKSAKLLAYRLKKQQATRCVYKIKDPQTDLMMHRTEEIHKCFKDYYTKLYSQINDCNESQIDDFLFGLNLPQIGEEQNNQIVSEITQEEINTAISKLKNNKSPGADGYTSEWYKVFRRTLTPLLHKTFNSILKGGAVPESWREAIISVIAKDGKDGTICSNYRPISVLNVDYRIFTAILARRMEKILPEIISLDQTGFIKHRQTNDNIRRTLHIMKHIKDMKLKALILGMDAEKAFDSVKWEFLFKVMKRFNFHERFIKTIKTLYTNPIARIKVNGSLSNVINLERGCRQGCSVSPLLFAIFLEPLSQWIKQNNSIKGVKVGGIEQKIAMFADDVLIYLENPELSLPILMKSFTDFGKLSGYKVNVQKTQVLTFNYEPNQNMRQSYNINWSMKSMKYLGVNLTKDLGQLKSSNYDSIISKIKTDFGRWNLIPYLSLATRVEMIKMNVLPRLLYLFQNLPISISEKEFTDWDKMISRFIWQGAKPRIKYRTLQLSKNKGGLALPCLKSYFQAAQLRVLLNLCNPDYCAKWKEIEEGLIVGPPIQAIVVDEKLSSLWKGDINQWLGVSVEVWNGIVKKYKLTNYCRFLRWIAYDLDFTPNKMDNMFKLWKTGPKMYWEVIKGKAIISFQKMKDTYNLQNKDFHRYLQLRHYLEQEIKSVNLDSSWPDLLKIIMDANGSQIQKAISKLYNILESLKADNTEYVKNRWEREANITMSAEDWEEINQYQWRTTNSNFWREYGWKNTIRYFVTPAQRKYADCKCWRSCGAAKADHFHIFWGCPLLTQYWTEINRVITKVLRTQIPINFEIMYLGKLENVNLERNEEYKLLRIMLLASKKAVTRRWRSDHIPRANEWIDIMLNIYNMEKLTASVRLEVDKFNKVWSYWLAYIKKHRSDFI